jgi:hypothetical protein
LKKKKMNLSALRNWFRFFHFEILPFWDFKLGIFQWQELGQQFQRTDGGWTPGKQPRHIESKCFITDGGTEKVNIS